MRLWLTPAQAEIIARQALDTRPQEACGLIAGIGEQARQIIPVANVASNAHRYFRLNDQALAKAVFEIERAGLSLIGIYHSHPEGEPIPSQTDIQQANYPDTIYLIVGLRHGQPRLAGWEIHTGMVTPVDLYVGTQQPPLQAPDLSNAQKTAIILAALVAFAFMLILSLSLLPPAPVIVTPLP